MITWPETESAVQTMPAIAITKNIPVVPERPKRSITSDEMMIVSIVIPDTGLRAVVAMALAATEAKKKEKIRVSSRPTRAAISVPSRVLKKTPAPTAVRMTPIRMVMIGMSRSVRSCPAASPCLKARPAMANEPATMRSDLRMPKIPAVAMAPTPMKRT